MPTHPLTKQEQAYLAGLIAQLSKKSKLSETQNLIVELHKKSQRSELETKKLRLLLKAEKIREDDLENKRQLQATLKAEQEQGRQLEQQKEILIGRKIIQAIHDNVLLGKDYPYTKLLKKMVEQNLFSTEEQALLAEFLVEPDSYSVKEFESNSNTVNDEAGEMVDNNLQDKNHQTNASDNIIAKSSNESIISEDNQDNYLDKDKNLS